MARSGQFPKHPWFVGDTNIDDSLLFPWEQSAMGYCFGKRKCKVALLKVKVAVFWRQILRSLERILPFAANVPGGNQNNCQKPSRGLFSVFSSSPFCFIHASSLAFEAAQLPCCFTCQCWRHLRSQNHTATKQEGAGEDGSTEETRE